MQAKLNTTSIDQYGLFRATDVDDAESQIAKLVNPHRIDIVDSSKNLDVNFKGIKLAGMPVMNACYGAKVNVGPETGDFYFANITLSGSGKISHENDGNCSAVAGETVVISPTAPYQLNLEAGCRRVVIGIKSTDLNYHLSKLINGEIKRTPVFDLKVSNNAIWLNTISYFFKQIEAQPKILESSNIQKMYSELIISNLLELHNHNYVADLNAKEDYMLCPQVKAAVDYIQENITEPITIADLAEHSNVSARTLHRNFIRHMNISPILYVRNAKLDSIHNDIKNYQGPINGAISRILLDHSVLDLGRFARYYKERFGCTPSESISNISRTQ